MLRNQLMDLRLHEARWINPSVTLPGKLLHGYKLVASLAEPHDGDASPARIKFKLG